MGICFTPIIKDQIIMSIYNTVSVLFFVLSFSYTAISSTSLPPCADTAPDETFRPPNSFDLGRDPVDTRGSRNVLFLVLHVVGQALSLACNGSIVAVIVRTSLLHTPSSVPVVALVFSDLLLSLVWHVSALVQISADLGEAADDVLLNGGGLKDPGAAISDNETAGGLSPAERSLSVLAYDRRVCHVVGFLWQTLISTSTLFQAAIACDRYLFIVHPLRYETFITVGKALVVLLILGILAALLPATVLISGGSYSYMPPASTCVSHITWYMLFIALVFLPSVVVIVLSYVGIWSLCVRQLSTPGRARLVRQVSPETQAYNLEEENGMVAVRRDIADEFTSTCCIPGLRRTSNDSQTSGRTSSSGCLNHLVQNSSLMFVEGLFATVNAPSPVVKKNGGGGGEGRGEEGTPADTPNSLIASTPACFVYPDTPTVLPPSPSPSNNTHKGFPSPSCPSAHLLSDRAANGRFHPATTRTRSEPEGCNQNFQTPYPNRKPVASPSIMSKHTLFRRTTSFQVSRVVLSQSPRLTRKISFSHGAPEDGSRPFSSEICSILGSPALPIKGNEMLELHSIAYPQMTTRQPGISSSPICLHTERPRFDRTASNCSISSAFSIHRSPLEQPVPSSAAFEDTNLSAVVYPIVGWVLNSSEGPNEAVSPPPLPRSKPLMDLLGSRRHSLKTCLTNGEEEDPATGRGGGEDSRDDEERGGGGGQEEGGEGVRAEVDILDEYDLIMSVKVPLRRWAKAALLVALPVVCLVVTVLPLVVVQTIWVPAGSQGSSISSSGATAWVCQVVYVILPSLNSFLMGLTNRHLRQSLTATLCRRPRRD